MYRDVDLFVGAVSFEERFVRGLTEFLSSGGDSKVVRLLDVAADSPQLQKSKEILSRQGKLETDRVQRTSSRALWDWVWRTLQNAKGRVMLDATCIPREVLGMLLFGLSVKREEVDRVSIAYTAASPEGYLTQNTEIPQEDRWLTKGVLSIRSIVGYPGDFATERERHVIALAGHETDRLFKVLVYLEPTHLSISGEVSESSTVDGAGELSKSAADDLRREIAVPKIDTVEFSANSIGRTFDSLSKLDLDFSRENVALVAMNTKLSFIGAALYALQQRQIRMVYAVPEIYNPLYSTGSGEFNVHDVSDLLAAAKTIPVRATNVIRVR